MFARTLVIYIVSKLNILQENVAWFLNIDYLCGEIKAMESQSFQQISDERVCRI
jgi:hypothetical protein